MWNDITSTIKKSAMIFANELRDKFHASIHTVFVLEDKKNGKLELFFYDHNRNRLGITDPNAPLPNGVKFEEYVTRFYLPIYDKAQVIHVDDINEWYRVLKLSKQNDYLIDYYDDVDNFQFGFIVRKNSGSYMYVVDYKNLYLNTHGYDFSTIDGIKKMVKGK